MSAEADTDTELVLGVDHVSITAPEELLEEVATWYRDTLRLREIERPEGTKHAGAWFEAGEQEIHLMQDPHNPPRQAHFALVVEDYSSMIERLRGFGCHIEQAASIPGRHRFYTRDPAGNRIEITSYDEPPADVRYVEAVDPE